MRIALLLFFVIACLFMAGSGRADDEEKKKQEMMNNMMKEKEHPCAPVEVVVFGGSRFHVKCSTPAANSIWYFAMPMKDPAATAAANVSLFAFQTGKPLYIEFSAGEKSGESYGCLPEDCRTIKAIWVSK